jgi:hypothetical protein
MGTRVPVGRRESQRLEFKDAEALKKPFGLSREIVAMLNGRGGELWIGLREDNGIAVEAQSIPDIDRAKTDLLNHLIEVVEPRLLPDEVTLEPVEHEGRNLLLVRVRPVEGRRPYAQLKEGARHFLLRLDHRVRPMTREELFEPKNEVNTKKPRLTALRDALLARNLSGFWVGVEPRPGLDLDVQERELQALLLDPTQSQNRRAGWNYGYLVGGGIKLAKDRVDLGADDDRKTTIWQDGCIEFWVTIRGLHHRIDQRKEIYPLALLEYSVSIMRLAAGVYGMSKSRTLARVVVDTALSRLDGWQLPAYAPGTYGNTLGGGEPEAVDEFILTKPLEFSWEEFQEHPDYAGYMLVRQIYQAFHLPEERIPRDYDRQARRLHVGD